MPPKVSKRLYLIPVLSKALDILELLQSAGEPLPLEAIYRRTGVSKTTVFRVLKTLVHRGYAARNTDGLYVPIVRPKKIRFGFAAQSAEMPFSVAVTESLKAAAWEAGIELMVLDNRYDATTAIQNAEEFVRSGVDLVVEFQVEQNAAPVIADKIAAAGIPMIAVDIPHPRSTFFGVDNYRVGFVAGEALAQYAVQHWKGKADWIMGLDLPEAGPVVQSRITGAFEGVKSLLPEIPVECYVRVDGRGLRDESRKAVSEFLARHPSDKNILIAGANDTSALGALDAVCQRKREKQVVIFGQDSIPEVMVELKKPRSPLIGTISHEAESYGAQIVRLGLALLAGATVPPYNYVEHRVVVGAG